ncbi:MAG: hypothetical protein AVDCRST_MAG93-4163 [uncultured Chloroflexia bacterium]|uniref:Glycosyl transferase family 1 domain-containing protein n=1 Tax=uncultured Chloroflexia bacterium TaxID=1672391 RepID=A0A6J4K354_9CHLR|nr:MAG: hypothetical protein AVDCRST_MAG93-4163 [uncultured Chloroflexia bacterium]
MPGLEAMAAGAVVVTPDAGGNMAYCVFGTNCLEVGLDDAAGYVEALEGLRSVDAGEVERFRSNGYATVGRHTLEHERERFGEFMGRLTDHLDRLGPGRKPAREGAGRRLDMSALRPDDIPRRSGQGPAWKS